MSGAGKKDLLLGVFVAAVAFLVYANSLGHGFVWDDNLVIVTNPALRGDPCALFMVIDRGHDSDLSPYYRPLTYFTFLAEERLHGQTALLMHLFNILLHSVNAFLVFSLARSFFKDALPSLFVGLLFAVHPVHAEAVNFLSGGRNTVLACFFVLLAYLLHRRSVVRGNIAGALAGSVLFLAGLFSKEIAFPVLPFIAALEFAPLRENAPGARSRAAVRLFPYAAATAVYLAMRWMALSSFGVQTSILPGFGAEALHSMYVIPGPSERFFNMVYSIPRYLLIVIWPTSLSPRYVVPDDLRALALPLGAAWLSIAVILGWLLTRGRSRPTLAGLLWLVAFWLPVSGIIDFPGAPLADRYLYLPAIGLWVIVADQAVRLLPSGIRSLRLALIPATLVLLVLSGLTVRRNLDWHSNMTLFSRLVEQYPENPFGHAGLGAAYFDRRGPRDLEPAELELNLALTLDPTLHGVYTPLGHIRLLSGDFEGASYYYSRTLSFVPADKDARINRGIAFDKLGRYGDAAADYQIYLSLPEQGSLPGSRAYAEERVRELTRMRAPRQHPGR